MGDGGSITRSSVQLIRSDRCAREQQPDAQEQTRYHHAYLHQPSSTSDYPSILPLRPARVDSPPVSFPPVPKSSTNVRVCAGRCRARLQPRPAIGPFSNVKHFRVPGNFPQRRSPLLDFSRCFPFSRGESRNTPRWPRRFQSIFSRNFECLAAETTPDKSPHRESVTCIH